MIHVIFAALFANTNVMASNYFRKLFISRQNDTTSFAYDATSFTCTVGPNSPQCSYHGVCTADGTNCICNTGFTTCYSFIDDSMATVLRCNYRQKSAVTAFLLELFFGEFGAGYFYLGEKTMGTGQVILTLFGGFLLCALVMCVGYTSSSVTNGFTCIVFIGCVWAMPVLAWWIAGCVTIGQGKVLDGNGCVVPSL
jgi:hypothetical protein